MQAQAAVVVWHRAKLAAFATCPRAALLRRWDLQYYDKWLANQSIDSAPLPAAPPRLRDWRPSFHSRSDQIIGPAEGSLGAFSGTASLQLQIAFGVHGAGAGRL